MGEEAVRTKGAKTVLGWNGRFRRNEIRGREVHELEKFRVGAG